MGEASLPSCHCIVLAVDCDAHGAKRGGPAGLTKPRQPASEARAGGVREKSAESEVWGGSHRANRKDAPKIRLKSCRGGIAAKRCQVCQRQL